MFRPLELVWSCWTAESHMGQKCLYSQYFNNTIPHLFFLFNACKAARLFVLAFFRAVATSDSIFFSRKSFGKLVSFHTFPPMNFKTCFFISISSVSLNFWIASPVVTGLSCPPLPPKILPRKLILALKHSSGWWLLAKLWIYMKSMWNCIQRVRVNKYFGSHVLPQWSSCWMFESQCWL